jgi:L-threonylcarbamoyladenylate synthase
MSIIKHVSEARALIKAGKVIAYPTEAVYGLGCDPFNQQAVEKILSLKQRNSSQGLIILISNWEQLAPLIAPISLEQQQKLKSTWPGPVTWIFPKSTDIPKFVSGEHESIAIRMSAHPLANEICLDGPIISTSANIHGKAPAVNLLDLQNQFPEGIDAILNGELGGLSQPSSIFDLITGNRLR